MGGWAAIGFALGNPDRVLSLVLSGTIGGVFTPGAEAAFDAARAAAHQTESGGRRPLGRHPALGRQFLQRDPAHAFLYQQIASLAPPPPGDLPYLLRETRWDLGQVRSLPCPVLWVVGQDDPIFPPPVIREAAAVLPGSCVVEIPDSGHSPYFEAPEAWNEVVRRFLCSGLAVFPPSPSRVMVAAPSGEPNLSSHAPL
jgi:pimeloyl-ACP methyl ester carboxylesterase